MLSAEATLAWTTPGWTGRPLSSTGSEPERAAEAIDCLLGGLAWIGPWARAAAAFGRRAPEAAAPCAWRISWPHSLNTLRSSG